MSSTSFKYCIVFIFKIINNLLLQIDSPVSNNLDYIGSTNTISPYTQVIFSIFIFSVTGAPSFKVQLIFVLQENLSLCLSLSFFFFV